MRNNLSKQEVKRCPNIVPNSWIQLLHKKDAFFGKIAQKNAFSPQPIFILLNNEINNHTSA
jgi:hypothetical protein